MEQATFKPGDVVVPSAKFKDHYTPLGLFDREHVVADWFGQTFKTTGDDYLYTEAFKKKETATMNELTTSTTAAVATVSNEEEPKVWAVEVQFPYNYAQDVRKQDRKTYEYLAFGLFDELAEATHVVVCKEQYTTIDGLLEADDLAVARVLNVKPVSQLRYAGTAKYIVDIIDATAFVERNMKAVRTEQLRKDIKARLEKIREISVLEKLVEETNDEVAKELLKELKELN